MLTRTQIENATTEELERLRGRIEAELQGRRGVEERNHQSAVEVLESHETPTGTFQWQMRECGHKERCNKCKSGKRHGSYLYRFYLLSGCGPTAAPPSTRRPYANGGCGSSPCSPKLRIGMG